MITSNPWRRPHLLARNNTSAGMGPRWERAPRAQPVADGPHVGASPGTEKQVPRDSELECITPVNAKGRWQPLISFNELNNFGSN